jgi:demethylmenaquinone methyltransferase/2-methoxy-6-polyprenyl-1,4-benzoquinol methylase
MTNRYYDPGHTRAEKVSNLFSVIARRYDLINDLQSAGLHRLWKRRVARLSCLGPGQLALDLCCGTGDISVQLANRGARVVGVDFSGSMLQVAANRQNRSEPSAITLIRADALLLPFSDASFDAVTVGYGLRNLASFDTGLSEMARVLKPGGRLVILDFGKPDGALLRWLYFSYLRCAVPCFGLAFCRDPNAYSYIFESLLHYPGQKAVAESLAALGFNDIRIIDLLGGTMAINYGVKG